MTTPAVNINTISPLILDARYEVRGEVTVRAGRYEARLNEAKAKGEPSGLPFDHVTFCNIGNPQKLRQQPMTFVRQVCALCEYPDLMNKCPDAFFPDAIARAKRLLDSGFLTGTYSHSKGHALIRKDVAAFITKRDGFECDEETIYCTDGASNAVRYLFETLIRSDEKTGIMTPIPQYPLFSALITLGAAAKVPYYLNEADSWSLGIDELERAYSEAVADGVHVKAIVVINPNNPTGQMLTPERQREVVEFCIRHKLLLIADEVYQENVYAPERRFISFRKIAHDMGEEKFNQLQIASLNSISKGFYGECGHRGGYFQIEHLPQDVHQQLYKLVSIGLCSNTVGQLVLDCLVNPPAEGDASYELYQKERNDIIASLKRRATKLCEALNSLEGFTCALPKGSMYLFPSISLPAKAVEEAKKAGVAPDMFYCLQLVDETGICVVPGSGFGQKDGTFHFRTTFLPPEDQIDSVVESLKTFNTKFLAKYK